MTRRRTQTERSEATKGRLIDVGRRLFAQRGFAATAADEIVARAGLSRGALYHHFGGKEGLFRAVFEQLEEDLVATIVTDLRDVDDVRKAIRLGLAAFLDACTDPDVVRIALTDAPNVLGWEAWQEIEQRYGVGVLRATIARAKDAAVIAPSLPDDALAQAIFGALIHSALQIAHADDRAAARGEAERALLAMIDGLRRSPDLDEGGR